MVSARMRTDRYYIVVNWLTRFSVHLALLIFSLVCLYPLLLIVSASFTDNRELLTRGFTLIPEHWTPFAYEYLLGNPEQILRAYGVTILITVVGTLCGTLMMAMFGYALSRRQFRLRGVLALLILFGMLFNGGLVPYYVLMTQTLGLRNSLLALILPGLINLFYILNMRSYFDGLPEELFDAARVDGANEFQIFFRIAMPMALPALATIGLLTALGYWNEWVNVLYFIDDPNKVTLQFLLHRIQQQIQFLNENPQFASMGVQLPEQSVRMAVAIISVGPAALAFLLFQKYLVKGITLGAFK